MSDLSNVKFSDKDLQKMLSQLNDQIDLVDLVPLTVQFQGKPLDIKNKRPMFSPVFKRVKKPKKIVYLCARQVGKAQSLDTPIVTPSGWTTIGELKVGDKVFSEDGSITVVTFVTPVMYDHECYKITFDNKDHVIADADHLWKVFVNNKSLLLTTTDLLPIYASAVIKSFSGFSEKSFRIKSIQLVASRPVRCIKVDHHSSMYLCGRSMIPTHNTTATGSSLVVDCVWRDHFNCLYVSPMSIYTQRMHSVFMLPMIRSCMLPWKIQNSTDCINNVHEKSFLTGSHYFGISAYNSAAQALGLSRIDSIMFDEVQDLNADLIPQIKETSGASDFRYESYFGTARSVDNTLTILFENSTQNYWHMTCPHCKKVNYPTLGGNVLDMIQKQGVSCVHCGKLLDVDMGRWVRSYDYDPTFRDADGFHVPQIIVKDRITPHERYIDTIYNKLHGSSAYSEARFLQEVLGIPTSQGGKPITPEDIKGACVLDIDKDTPVAGIQKYQRVAAGVDWGGSEITSFTVGVIIGYSSGMFDVVGAVRPTGLPDEQRHIAVGRFLNKASSNCIQLVGADAGFVGSVQNPNLGQVMGKQVASISYGTTKKFLSPHINNHFTVDRTTLLYIVLTLIKQKKIRFPKGDWFEIYTRDLLSIYTEDVVSSQGMTMRRYARYTDKPDDFLHALGYGLLMCSLGIVDLPEMVGMQSDTSINAPYIGEIGVEMGYATT
jgi:phage FluMu protein Com